MEDSGDRSQSTVPDVSLGLAMECGGYDYGMIVGCALYIVQLLQVGTERAGGISIGTCHGI